MPQDESNVGKATDIWGQLERECTDEWGNHAEREETPDDASLGTFHFLSHAGPRNVNREAGCKTLSGVGWSAGLDEAAARQGDVLVFEFSGFIAAGSSFVCHPSKSARPPFSRTDFHPQFNRLSL